MSFHTYKVEHYSKNTDGSYITTPTLFTNIVSVSVNLKSKEAADSFSISITDVDGGLLESAAIDDRLKIYGSLDSTTYTLLIDGIINQKQYSEGTDNSIVTMTGLNRLEKLFNSIVSTTGEDVRRTASFWIKNIIDQVNQFNDNGGTNRVLKYIYNGLDQDDIATSEPDTITETGETISFVRNFQKAFKLIEELSQPKFTGGSNYVYYLDSSNVFYFEPRSDIKVGTLTYGTEVYNHRTQKGMFDVVNYIIMNAGKSLFGASILQFGYKAESINKFGWKVKLFNEAISSTLGTEEVRNMRNRGVYDEESVYPTSYSPAYRTSWGDDVTTDKEYNDSFVDVALATAKDKIDELLERNGGASYKIDLNVLPDFGYALYNNYELVIPDNGDTTEYRWSIGVTLRIDTITWTFNEQGWTTSLKMVQDDDASEGSN